MSGHYLLFVATVVGLIAVPGPDMLYVLGRAVAGGRRSAICSAAGVAAGYALVTILVAAGFQAAFDAWPQLFSILKYAGALYLTYLAWRLTSSAGASRDDSASPSAASDWRAFASGAATSALNPKGLLFYFSILPQFFVAGSQPFWQYALIYGFTTCFLCLTLYSALGSVASLGARRWATDAKAQRRMSRISGFVLLAAVVTLLGTDGIARK